MKTSVVVAVKNRESCIGLNIESLLASRTKYPFDIWIVDDHSTDRTAQIAGHYPVHLITSDGEGVSAARNTGIRRTDADIVAITDSDCLVDGDWIEILTEKHARNPDAIGITGRVSNHDESSRISRVVQEKCFAPPSHHEEFTWKGPGNNIAYKRKRLMDLGLFDESLRAGEDPELNWRIHKAGLKILFTPEMHVQHMNRDTLHGMIQQQIWWGIWAARLRRRIPELPNIRPLTTRKWLEDRSQSQVPLPQTVSDLPLSLLSDAAYNFAYLMASFRTPSRT